MLQLAVGSGFRLSPKPAAPLVLPLPATSSDLGAGAIALDLPGFSEVDESELAGCERPRVESQRRSAWLSRVAVEASVRLLGPEREVDCKFAPGPSDSRLRQAVVTERDARLLLPPEEASGWRRPTRLELDEI